MVPGPVTSSKSHLRSCFVRNPSGYAYLRTLLRYDAVWHLLNWLPQCLHCVPVQKPIFCNIGPTSKKLYMLPQMATLRVVHTPRTNTHDFFEVMHILALRHGLAHCARICCIYHTYSVKCSVFGSTTSENPIFCNIGIHQ